MGKSTEDTRSPLAKLCYEAGSSLDEALLLEEEEFVQLSKEIVGNGVLEHARVLKQWRHCRMEALLRQEVEKELEDAIEIGCEEDGIEQTLDSVRTPSSSVQPQYPQKAARAEWEEEYYRQKELHKQQEQALLEQATPSTPQMNKNDAAMGEDWQEYLRKQIQKEMTNIGGAVGLGPLGLGAGAGASEGAPGSVGLGASPIAHNSVGETPPSAGALSGSTWSSAFSEDDDTRRVPSQIFENDQEEHYPEVRERLYNEQDEEDYSRRSNRKRSSRRNRHDDDDDDSDDSEDDSDEESDIMEDEIHNHRRGSDRGERHRGSGSRRSSKHRSKKDVHQRDRDRDRRHRERRNNRKHRNDELNCHHLVEEVVISSFDDSSPVSSDSEAVGTVYSKNVKVAVDTAASMLGDVASAFDRGFSFFFNNNTTADESQAAANGPNGSKKSISSSKSVGHGRSVRRSKDASGGRFSGGASTKSAPRERTRSAPRREPQRNNVMKRSGFY